MKNIAMITCRNVAHSCAGVGCMKAFNGRTGPFAAYEGEDLQLIAYIHCNGCESKYGEDESLQKKLDRLKKEETDVVHLGICTVKEEQECPTILAMAADLEASGITIVRRTH